MKKQTDNVLIGTIDQTLQYANDGQTPQYHANGQSQQYETNDQSPLYHATNQEPQQNANDQAQQYDAGNLANIYKYEVAFRTYGYIPTGYQEYSLQQLAKELKKQKQFFLNNKKVLNIIMEIQSRFLGPLNVPCVQVKKVSNLNKSQFASDVETMVKSFVFGLLKGDFAHQKISVAKPDLTNRNENKNLKFVSGIAKTHIVANRPNIALLYDKKSKNLFSLFEIAHECKHISQYYELYKMSRLSSFENTKAVASLAVLYDAMYKNLTVDYANKLYEFDANLFAIKVIDKLTRCGELKDNQEVLKLILRVVRLRRKFKFENEQICPEIKDQIKTNFEQATKRFVNEPFVDASLKNIAMQVDIDKYLSNIEKQLQKLTKILEEYLVVMKESNNSKTTLKNVTFDLSKLERMS